MRITGQLIDAATGAHLWADRFEGGLEDVFDLQDQVTTSVVGAIAPKLEQAEIERSRRKPTENLDAYDYFLRGMAAVDQWTREANRRRCRISTGPSSSTRISLRPMAWRPVLFAAQGGWLDDRSRTGGRGNGAAGPRAVELGRDDAVALCTAGIALAFVVGDVDDAVAFTDRALVLNPNLTWAWLFGGWVKLWTGEPEVAIERLAQAMRLSPNDPQKFTVLDAMATAQFSAGRYSEALSWAKASLREKPAFPLATCIAAASGALSGHLAEAEKTVASLLRIEPGLRISSLTEQFPELAGRKISPDLRRPCEAPGCRSK